MSKFVHVKHDCRVHLNKNGAGNSSRGNNGSTKSTVHGQTRVQQVIFVHHQWFENLSPIEERFIVKIVDQSIYPIYGVGDVSIKITSRKTIKLFDVYVPKLCKNLVSGNCLNSDVFKLVYEYDRYILYQHGMFNCFGYLRNHMFH